MQNFKWMLLATCFLCLGGIAKGQNDWKQDYEKNGLVIYTRSLDNSDVKEFRAEMTVEARLASVVTILIDYANHKTWMYSVADCEQLSRKNDQERELYYKVDFPWPLDDRDIVNQTIFSQDAITGVVTYQLTSTPNKHPSKDFIRMQVANGTWKVIPKPQGKVFLTYQHQSDSGDLPAWVVNLFLLDGPKGTFQSLKQVIDSGAYDSAEVPWLVTPE